MIQNPMLAHAEVRDYGKRVALFLAVTDAAGRPDFVAQPVEFAKREGDGVEAPALLLEQEDAQRLFDALYAAGLRPTADPRDPSAQARHLEDMRTLAERLLDHVLAEPPPVVLEERRG